MIINWMRYVGVWVIIYFMYKILQQNNAIQQEKLTIENLALQSSDLARMEYGFLYDETRHLLAIGYNVDERRRDPSYYDLLGLRLILVP